MMKKFDRIMDVISAVISALCIVMSVVGFATNDIFTACFMLLMGLSGGITVWKLGDWRNK
jgi:hypothetical protein